jgi:hypothetical protein
LPFREYLKTATNQILAITTLLALGKKARPLPYVIARKMRGPRSVPVSMPPSVGNMGFDVSLWLGLGLVGLWSALDAFAEK